MTITQILNRNARYIPSMEQSQARQSTSVPAIISQALVGQLLGDAFASRSSPTANTRIEWSFGVNVGAYANYIATLFGPYCNTGLIRGGTRLKTVTLPLFNYFHDIFYTLDTVTGRYVKVVPVMIMELMSPIVLAHLIMGDGNYHVAEQYVRIYTNGFTHADCIRLAASITTLGIPTTVRKDKVGLNGEQQYLLAINKPYMSKLREVVVPHMHSSMLYRVGL